MALAVDGVPVSGSTGNKTFSRNRFGAYIRRRVSGVNPNSTKQNNSRAAFRAAVIAWNALDSTTRGGWSAYAEVVPWLNKAGQSVRLTGLQMFLRYYAFYLGYKGVAPTTLTAPLIFNLGSIDIPLADAGATIDISASTLEVTGSAPSITNTWDPAGGVLGIEISKPSNLGNRFPAGPWSSVGFVDGAGTGDYSATIALADLPYPPAVGQQVWLRFRGLGVIATDRRLSEQTIVGPVIVDSVP